jgi:cytochrome P450
MQSAAWWRATPTAPSGRAFCVVVLVAGHETSASAMSVALEYLARHPEARKRLAQAPRLIPTAAEEFVRYSTPIQTFGRNAVDDIEVAGQLIEKGAVVGLCYGSANRDPDQFDHPDDVLLDRSPNRHVGFGSGPHLCLGAHVARLEMAIMLQVFAGEVNTLSLVADDQPEWAVRGDRRGLVHLPVKLT